MQNSACLNNRTGQRQDLQHCLLVVTVRGIARPRFRLSIVKWLSCFFRPPPSSPYVVERFHFLSSFFTFLVACCDSSWQGCGEEGYVWMLSNVLRFVQSCFLKHNVNSRRLSAELLKYICNAPHTLFHSIRRKTANNFFNQHSQLIHNQVRKTICFEVNYYDVASQKQIYLWENTGWLKNEDDEIGARSTYGWDEKCVQNFGPETCRKETTRKT
jgi:hypothetical protein